MMAGAVYPVEGRSPDPQAGKPPLPPICVDGRLLDEPRSGVAHYGDRLVRALAAHGDAPWRLDARLPEGDRHGSDPRRFLKALRPWPRPALAEPGTAQAGAWRGRMEGADLFREAYLHFKLLGRLMPVRTGEAPGIMHWTYPLPLRMAGWRNIYTIHDLIPLTTPDLSPVKGDRLARLVRAIAASADRIVTVTQAVRREVIAATGCAPELVVACHQAVDEGLTPAPPPEADAPFFFCGSIEPRKNLVRLVEAYRLSGSRRALVIAGEDGWRADAVRAAIGDAPGVTFKPFLDRAALLAQMCAARALLFPSLAEGFGLPVAEAMTMGVPVMTSALPALAEVAGNAALLVDPADAGAIATAIGALDQDDALCARLRQAGLAKAVDYGPRAYYDRLERIYADVAQYPRSAMAGA
ncbi:glycosyltransferase family 4 protein [Sphingobium fontiphilum]|nr:glycosyltransferase family 1 protein [Sphingobium fontiphilum]